MEQLKIKDWRVGVAIGALSAVVLHFTFPLLLFLAFAIVFILLGAILALFPNNYERRTKDSFPSPPKPNIDGTLSKIKVYPPPVVRPALFTTNVDNHIQEILDLTLKHHAIPAYKIVARDEQALFGSITPVVWTTLSALTQRASQIDMMKMTQDMVKVLRVHFEHFRGFHFREVQTQFPQLDLYPYLESPEHELTFLRQACEVLLCISLPKEHLQCTPIRVLIREYLTGQLLQPTIEMICDPDYINQKLLGYLNRREEAIKSASTKYHSRTFEDFVKNIKKIEDLLELHQMRQFIITDIIQAKAVQKMKSKRVKGLGGGGFPIPIPAEKARSLMERDLRVYVTQLETAKTVCERQVRNLGGEDYEAENPQASDKVYESSQTAERSLTLLPFEAIMSNRAARQVFLKFLEECGFSHLLLFWEDTKRVETAHPDSLHKLIKEILDRYLLHGAESSLYAEEEVVVEIQGHLEGEREKCVPVLVEIQREVYVELQEHFYNDFTRSLSYRELLQQIVVAGAEGGNPELQELGRFSEGAQGGDLAPLDPTRDESQHKLKLQTLMMELEETDNALASMPENVGSSSLAQRKKALNKDRLYLNGEIKKLEHYIDHTNEWFGTIGKWSVEVHTVDLSEENEKDPLFVIVVHRPEFSKRRQQMGLVAEGKEGAEGESRSDIEKEHWEAREKTRDRGSTTPVSLYSPPSSPLTQSPIRQRHSSMSSDGGRSETFEVVDESDEALKQQPPHAGWVVGRRWTDFQQLHLKVVEISPLLLLPPLPKRLNPFNKPDSGSKYWQKYRLALQTYLCHILKDVRLQESEEVFNFLSPASENLRQSSLIHPERKKHSFSISVPLFSKDEEESTTTDQMYALLSEIFELDEWSRVLRKQLMDFVQLTYGKNLHRSVQESINWMVSEPMLIFYLETFRDATWPDGQSPPSSPIRSDEQKAQTKYEAKKKFLKSSPQGVQTILGQRNCQIGFQKIFEALQDPRANKQLFYALFELLLYAMVPELEYVEIEEAVADWKAEV